MDVFAIGERQASPGVVIGDSTSIFAIAINGSSGSWDKCLRVSSFAYLGTDAAG